MRSELMVLNNLLQPWCRVVPDPDAPITTPSDYDYSDGPIDPPMIAIIRPDLYSPSRARSIIQALDRVNPWYADILRDEQRSSGIPYERYVIDQQERIRGDIICGRLTVASRMGGW